jgi:hypothetical protein
MPAMLRTIGRWLIILFCLFHMTAIAVYLLPNGWLVKAKEIASPYVLSTSQWQKWDIFSPNPLRRVSMYSIERWKGGDTGIARTEWETLHTLHPSDFPWYERATMMKVLERLEEDEWLASVPQFLLSVCAEDPSNKGRTIRLANEYTVIPDSLHALKHLSAAKLSSHRRVLNDAILCPS